METGNLAIYTIVKYFDADGEHQEKEVVLFTQEGVSRRWAKEFVEWFRLKQVRSGRTTCRLSCEEIFAVWAQKVVL